MNYKKIYDSLMESRFKLKSEREIKRKDKIERYEIHHIIPRTLHGTNSEENLIILTLREHFMSHYMLHKIYGGRMSYAFKAMCDFKRYKDYTISAREYEKLKTLFANTISEFTKKRFENPNARIYLSEFQKTLWETDSEYKRKRKWKNRDYIEHQFYFSGEIVRTIKEWIPNKRPTNNAKGSLIKPELLSSKV